MFIHLLTTQFALANTIDTVVVFSDRAEVTRIAKTECTNGTGTIHFGNIPYSIDTRTLRADLSTPSSSIIGVQQQMRVLDQSINEQGQDLLEQKEVLLDKQLTLSDQNQLLKEEYASIEQYESIFYSTIQTELQANKDLRNKWRENMRALAKSKRTNSEQQIEINEQINGIQREIQSIDRQLQLMNITPRTQVIDADVLVKCNGTSVSAQLHYVTPSATWAPESDLFVTTEKNSEAKIDLQVSAKIRQSTGEDWSDATIILSTAKPNLGAEALFPAPIYVNGQPNKEQKVMVQKTEDRSSLSNAGATTNQSQYAQLEDGGQSMRLKLPHRTTIVSNGQEHWVPIDRLSTEGAQTLVCIPRANPLVFDTVKFNNPAPYSLISSVMHLYQDGVFLGDHYHETIASGEQMELALSSLPYLQIQRETVQDKRDQRILGKNQQIQRAYRVNIENLSSTVERIEVRESIPVSKHEDISVILDIEETSKGFTLDEYKGFVSWTIDVAGNQKKAIDLMYQVELPASWDVR